MPRLLSFLAVFLTFFVSAPSALAAGEPPPPPVSQNNPANPPAPPVENAGDKNTARKEDEENTTAGLLARIRAYGKGTAKLANDVAGLQKQVKDLQAEVAARDQRIAELTAENERMSTDLAAFADWLEANGNSLEAAVKDPAKAFKSAVGERVAHTVREIGVKKDTLKTNPAADGNATTLEQVEALLAAAKTPEARQEILTKYKTLIMQSN